MIHARIKRRQEPCLQDSSNSRRLWIRPKAKLRWQGMVRKVINSLWTRKWKAVARSASGSKHCCTREDLTHIYQTVKILIWRQTRLRNKKTAIRRQASRTIWKIMYSMLRKRETSIWIWCKTSRSRAPSSISSSPLHKASHLHSKTKRQFRAGEPLSSSKVAIKAAVLMSFFVKSVINLRKNQ